MLRNGDINPSEPERLDIIRRLLKLARAGRCGAIYCDGGVLRMVRDSRISKPWPLSWRAASKLADTWVEPKPAARESLTKRVARLPGSGRKLA